MENPIRLTTSHLPRTKERRDKVQIPIGIIFDPIPENLTVYDCELPKCTKCNGYPIPESPNKCPFCGSPIPSINFQIPSDAEWKIQSNNVPKSIFLIDTSFVPQDGGYFTSILDTILNSLPPNAINMAFVTITTELCYLLPGGKIGISPDLEGTVLPPNAFLKTKPESLNPLISFTHKWKNPDIIAALDMLSNVVGSFGHIFLFLTSSPSSFSRIGAETESSALRGSNFNERLQQITKKLQVQSASIDTFVFKKISRDVDCTSLNKMCSITGGRLFYMNANQEYELVNCLTNFLHFNQTICELRASDDAKILPSLGLYQHHPSSFQATSPQSLVFPLLLPEVLKKPLTIQATVKYYGIDGTFHMRVYSRTIPVSDDLSLVINSSYEPSIFKYITCSLLDLFYHQNSSMEQMKDLALGFLKPIFFSYRYHISRSPNRFSNFVMPDSLKLLPYHVLGLLKSTAFSRSISYDDRGYELGSLNLMRPEKLLEIGFPQVMEITSYLKGEGDIQILSLNEGELTNDRFVILYDGFNSYLWVGSKIDKEICKKVFGVQNPDLVNQVLEDGDEVLSRFRSLMRGNVRIFKESTSNLLVLYDRLVERASTTLPSYQQWLIQLHRITLPREQY
ncbi:Protein transport protein SEC24 [Histomonas meleagridis]|uniref:Protein transport protein SEC24 n=1 Tax=Histomonas meleagridis TaxID=135588 RepID=UPI0035594ADC|nr:Protein transport protein SEC24 [Histomonas meleagridis]KAH0803935.1 Protein transport protein SEC24 [Histomonas meleagridis]